MEKIRSLVLTNKKLLFLIAIPLVIVIVVLFVFLGGLSDSLRNDSQNSNGKQVQQPFSVLITSPQNGQADVYSGEIKITFTTSPEIISEKSFSFSLDPQPSFPLQTVNTYPASTIIMQVLGGLKQSTLYTATVKNSQGKEVYSWKFTTSNKTPQSSSKLEVERDKSYAEKNYPLLPFVPYSSGDFVVDYTAPLTLQVKTANKNAQEARRDVEAWIKSHGVDPSTHTINITTPAP